MVVPNPSALPTQANTPATEVDFNDQIRKRRALIKCPVCEIAIPVACKLSHTFHAHTTGGILTAIRQDGVPTSVAQAEHMGLPAPLSQSEESEP
jgi:hypothetical protein